MRISPGAPARREPEPVHRGDGRKEPQDFRDGEWQMVDLGPFVVAVLSRIGAVTICAITLQLLHS
jgi:hypothetical protein